MSAMFFTDDAAARSVAPDSFIELQQQEPLLDSGALQNAIFNSAHFSSIATDARGVIQIFNVGAERMLGYKAADVIGKISPADISDPQELIAHAEALSVELNTPIAPGFDALVFKASRGIEDIYELTYIRKDGSRLPAVVSVTGLRDAQNKVIGYLLIGTDNTARKEANAAQALLDQQTLARRDESARAESRFKSIIDMAEEAVICVDHLHHIVVFNQGAERIFGYAARDILGQSLSRLIPARFMQDHGRHMSGFSAQVTSTRAMNPQREIYGLRSDGTEFPAEASITRATDKGNILLSVVLRDITERTRAQNELSLSEARFRSFFEQSAVGMVIASDSGAFLQVNQQFADIIGYTQEEIVGQLCAEATHPDDRGHEAASIAKLLDGKSTGSTWEKRYVRKDGRAVWCLLSLSLLNLKEDNSRQFIGVVKDITDRKRAEEALAQSQTLLRIAGDAAKLGGWVVDLPGYVVHWSDEVRAIHQVPPDFEPTLAQGIGFYPPEYRPQVAEHVRRCAEDGTPFNFEHELITATGRRIWVQAIGEAVLDQQGAIVGIQGALQDISARKASEASLAESQRRFRAMADSFPFIVWTAEPDGRVDYANRAFSAYNRSRQRAASEASWKTFVHPDDLTRCQDAWRTAVRTGEVYLEDYRLQEAASGDYHWYRVRAEPLRDDAGHIIKWYGSATDIHETKSLEHRAISLASRLNNTLESITDGFFILDADWTFAFLNTQALHVLGGARDDLLCKDFWAEFPQLVGSVLQVQCLEAARSGLPVQMKECQLVSPDHWYDVSIYPSEDGLAVYFHDVTQTRAALAELRLLRTAVSRLNDIVLITEAEPFDKPGPRIVFANEAFERITGYTLAEVLGKSPRILQGPKTQLAELHRIGQALKNWQPVRAELINYTKDGEEFWLELDIVPIADSKGWYTHWVAIERDISDRKMTEQAILQLNSELEDRVIQRTQQLEAANKELEAFSYSVSHDLRSPLNTINGFSQLLLKSDGAQLSEKGRHYLNRVRAGANNMGVLIDGLLSLAKLSRTTLNCVDVDLTTMSLKLVRQLRDAEPDRVVDIDVQPGLMINGDPAMVTVVMQNLMANAWKYSSKASHARIGVGSETAADGITCIYVRDNGAGFDMAYAEKLFEVFQRLHQDSEFTGTGIGLANVKRVVERHGGRVWAQASPGEGAIFRFTLQGQP